jgi:hypothetical protein
MYPGPRNGNCYASPLAWWELPLFYLTPSILRFRFFVQSLNWLSPLLFSFFSGKASKPGAERLSAHCLRNSGHFVLDFGENLTFTGATGNNNMPSRRRGKPSMPKGSAIKFQSVFAWLMTEILHGRAHYEIVRGLGRRDPRAVAAFRTAPRFFELTLGAHADLSNLALTRIFDRAGAISIYKLLSTALYEAGTFKHANAAKVREAVQNANASIKALEPSLRAIRTRRNETVAHSDTRPLIDPIGYMKDGRISYREIEGLFAEVGKILNEFSLLSSGVPVSLALEDAKDYEQVIDLLAAGAKDPAPSS